MELKELVCGLDSCGLG